MTVTDRFRNLPALVRGKANANGDKPLVVFKRRSLSYKAFEQLTSQIAAAFARSGLKPGDIAAVAMLNDPMLLALWIGLLRIGCTVGFINPHYTGQSLQALIDRLEPRLLVTQSGVLDEPAVKDLQQRHGMMTVEYSEEGSSAGSLLPQLGDLLDGSLHNGPVYDSAPGDVAGLIHTSGTTGTPKFCMLSHAHYLTAGLMRIRILGALPADRLHVSMPLYHTHGHLIAAMLADSTMVLSTRFSASTYWKEVRDTEATLLLLHDQPMVMLLKQPPSKMDRSHVARIAHPGFRLQKEFHDRFGVDVTSVYGGTEAGTIAAAPWYRPHVDPDYYSTASPGLEIMADYYDVRIVDENDVDVPAGEVGEIKSKQRYPHTRFDGYFRDDAQTNASIKDGWFYHNDLGRLDGRGLLHFVARKSESIRHRGEWIPQELVENILDAHPLVESSALVGVPSGLGDQDLKVYVVGKPLAAIEPKELLDYLSEQVPYFMVPRFVEFVSELPRIPGLDKIARAELRGRGVAGAWDGDQAGYRVKRRMSPLQ